MNGRVKANVSEDLPVANGTFELQAGHRTAQYPGGLPRFDRASSQSPPELTTLILLVPLSI
jgi:hypothetical protein